MPLDPADAELPRYAIAPDASEGPEAPDLIAALQAQLSRSEDQALRSAADLDNLRKRFRREVSSGQTAERRRTLTLWAESLDDLERALAHADENGPNAIIAGVQSVVANAVTTIASLGYERFGASGDTFDPEIHQVITTVPARPDTPANVIVAIITSGYGTAADLLRPASVVVAKDAD